MAKYYGIATNIGEAAIANAFLANQKIEIKEIAIGDGGGAYYEPTASMTALKNEVYRVNADIVIDASSPNVVQISGILPSNVGGFTVRELGAIDKNGKLIGIANVPDAPKVILEEGADTEMDLGFGFAVSHSEVISLVIDPTIIIATKKDVKVAVDRHVAEPNPHPNSYYIKVESDEQLSKKVDGTISKLTEYLFVDPVNGNDEADGKTKEAAIKTLSKMEERFNLLVDKRSIYIRLLPGTHHITGKGIMLSNAEYIVFSPILSSDIVNISVNVDPTTYTPLRFGNCGEVAVQNITNFERQGTASVTSHLISVYGCAANVMNVHLKHSALNNNSIGIYYASGSTGQIGNCSFENCGYAIESEYGSDMSTYSVTGANNNVGLYARSAIIRKIGTVNLNAAVPESIAEKGEIV